MRELLCAALCLGRLEKLNLIKLNSAPVFPLIITVDLITFGIWHVRIWIYHFVDSSTVVTFSFDQLYIDCAIMTARNSVSLGIVILIILPIKISSRNPNTTVITAAIVLNKGTGLPFDYDKMMPAFNLAFAKSQQLYNVRFQPYLGLSYSPPCSDVQALGQAVTALQQYSIQVFFGPACYDELLAVSKISSFYNITLMSGAGSFMDSVAALAYPYLTRTAYNMADQWSIFIKMCGQYNWDNVAVVYDQDSAAPGGGIYQKNGEGLIKILKNNNLKPADIPSTFQRAPSDPVDPRRLDRLLVQASNTARIIVLVTDFGKIRSFMIQALRRGMCNGDYAFFAADALRSSILVTRSWIVNDAYDTEAEGALQCLFVIALRDTKKDLVYQTFRQEIARYGTNGSARPGADSGLYAGVDYYQGTFYDAVMVYAAAVNDTLEDGLDITAANVQPKLINRTFAGAYGTVRIGPSSDRVSDYEILQLRNNETIFMPFAEVRAETGQYKEIRQILWLNKVSLPPPNKPPCGFDGNDPICAAAAKTTLAAGLGGALGLLLVSGIISVLVYRRIKLKMELNNMNWIVAFNEISVQKTTKTRSVTSTATESVASLALSVKSYHPVLNFAKSTQAGLNKPAPTMMTDSIMQTSVTMVTFRNTPAILRPCDLARIDLTEKIRTEVRIVKSLSNENIVKFLGACIELTHTAVLVEYCSRGSLHDVLHNDALNLEWIFRLSFLTDIIQGLSFIHNSVLEYHGRLTSRCCFIDKRFLLKISDYGLPSFYNAGRLLGSADLLWTAPELLRAKDHVTPTPEADIYSIGIMLQEIILRESPYYQTNMISEDIIWHLIACENPPFRPSVDDPFCNPDLIKIMHACWSENPSDRPRLTQLRNSIKTLARSFGIERNNIIDTLLERMEQHTHNLESIVAEKTTELLDEKKKTDHLLYSILPKAVAEQLKRGQHVLPESFESVTVYFGDIVEFTMIASSSGPLDMVNFMNDLYSQFDAIIAVYDAYKVETIGDCYLIVSGLPNRNGLNHAVEIARIAFDLRETIQTFVIRHLPEKRVQLRIGLNSGPCVAGVVGFATPRYCLFGDTVNVASRMESTGEPMKIQITAATEGILRKFQSFIVECRGEITVKGKGVMHTYWLVGENKALYHAVL